MTFEYQLLRFGKKNSLDHLANTVMVIFDFSSDGYETTIKYGMVSNQMHWQPAQNEVNILKIVINFNDKTINHVLTF